jgi:hypothetical protein
MKDASKKQKACTVYPELFRLALGAEHRYSFPMVPRSDRTRRTLVRRILRELYEKDGPRGYSDKDVLEVVNAKLGQRGAGSISQSTMRRARRDEYGW